MHRRSFLAAAGTAAGALALTTSGAAGATRAATTTCATPIATDTSAADGAAFIAARRMIDLPMGRIACVDVGRGRATLFLHGYPLNGFQWRGAVARLRGERRCIVPDMMGLGYTEVASGTDITPAAQVRMLVALLDHLGVEQVDLVGSDSGGALAQLFAVQHPSRVRAMFLANCDTEHESPPPPFVPAIEQAREGRFARESLVPQFETRAKARLPDGLGGLCYTYRDQPTDDTVGIYFAPLVRDDERLAQTDGYAVALGVNPLVDIGPKLAALRIPTRVVWGLADIVFSTKGADYLEKTLGNLQSFTRMPHAMLFWPEEFPDLVAEEVRAFQGTADSVPS